MTKEEILAQLQKENPHSIPTFKAMDVWAEQQAIAFNEWFMKLTAEKFIYYIVEKGSDSPIVQYYTRKEMYDQFIEQNQQ